VYVGETPNGVLDQHTSDSMRRVVRQGENSSGFGIGSVEFSPDGKWITLIAGNHDISLHSVPTVQGNDGYLVAVPSDANDVPVEESGLYEQPSSAFRINHNLAEMFSEPQLAGLFLEVWSADPYVFWAVE